MTPTTYIKDITAENTGGHCLVDLVHLHTGQILGIDDDCVVLYANQQDYDDCFTKDRPTISLNP